MPHLIGTHAGIEVRCLRELRVVVDPMRRLADAHDMPRFPRFMGVGARTVDRRIMEPVFDPDIRSIHATLEVVALHKPGWGEVVPSEVLAVAAALERTQGRTEHLLALCAADPQGLPNAMLALGSINQECWRIPCLVTGTDDSFRRLDTESLGDAYSPPGPRQWNESWYYLLVAEEVVLRRRISRSPKPRHRSTALALRS